MKADVIHCPNCGAPVSEYASQCSYCKSHIARAIDKFPTISVCHKPIKTLKARVAVPEWALDGEPREIARYAIKELQDQMLDAVCSLMEITVSEDYLRFQRVFDAKLEVVIPNFR